MKRVLSITAGIMGLWLILGVGGLAIVRARQEAQPTMLVDAPDDIQPDKRAVYMAGFGSRLHQKLITGYVGYVGRGWSPDGEWFYLGAIYETFEFQYEDKWQIHRDSYAAERRAGTKYPLDAQWTDDGQSLLYGRTSFGDEAPGLIRVNPDTGLEENLTPDIGVGLKTPFPECAIIETANWTYFCAGIYDRTDLYRLSRDGQLENLTEHMEWPTGLMAYDENGEWLIIRSLGQLYILNAGDSDPQLLFPERLKDKKIKDLAWLPSFGLFIVETEAQGRHYLWGFDISNRRLLWREHNNQFVGVTSDGWLILNDEGQALVRVRPDGTNAAPIVGIGENENYFGMTPDSQWLLVSRGNPNSNSYDLWRVPLMGGEHDHFYHVSASPIYAQIITWSPNQRWILLELNSRVSSHTEWVNLENGEVRPVVEWGDARFLDWFGTIDRDWQPLGLIGIGGVLIGINRVMARTKKSA